MKNLFHSLTGRTLLYIALAMTAAVALASVVSYRLTYSEVEQNLRDQLLDQISRSAHRQQERLILARDAQESIKKLVLDRLAQPAEDDVDKRFNELFMVYPDGAIRNRPQYSDGSVFATMWAPRKTVNDAQFRRLYVLFYDICQQYGPLLMTRFFNFWLVTPEGANIAYDPERPNWVYDAPADYDPTAQEWVALGTPQRNPSRETVWSRPELDPIGNTYEISAVTPLDMDGRHIASMGSALNYESLVHELHAGASPWSAQVVFRKDGLVIAHSEMNAEIMAANGTLTVDTIDDSRLQPLFSDTLAAAAMPAVGFNAATDHYYAVTRLDVADWYTASLVPGELVRNKAFRASQWVLWSGFAALAMSLIVLTAIMRRQVARPLHRVLDAAQRISDGQLDVRIDESGADEIGRLATRFNAMADKVRRRDNALRQEKQELQQALTGLSSAEERLRALLEHSADVISVVNAEGKVLYASPSIKTRLGYTPEELLGRPAFDIVHPEDHAAIINALSATLIRPELPIGPLEYRVKTPQGEWRDYAAVGTNQLANPAVNGIVINGRDVTEEKRAAQELQSQRERLHQTEKLSAMGSLLAGVAHELNNPLSIVIGRAIMLESDATDAAQRGSIAKLRTAAERCARIVKTFLAMARQNKPQREGVNLNDIVTDVLDIFGYNLRSHGIAVQVELAADLPTTAADADQMHQVFLNLIVNAQQAMAGHPPPRHLRVSTHNHHGKEISVIVEDTGPGVSDTIRTRVFDPFFTTKEMGTGVGLAVSLGLVEAHGGRIDVERPQEGGARFKVTLPVVALDARVQPVDSKSAPCADGKSRVLVVDDEPEICDMLRDVLCRNGYGVRALQSARTALAYLQHETYDAIITDLRMPDLDGPGFYAQVRERYPQLARRVVFISGDALSTDSRRFVEQTGCPIVEKPFTLEEVLSVLNGLVSQSPRAAGIG